MLVSGWQWKPGKSCRLHRHVYGGGAARVWGEHHKHRLDWGLQETTPRNQSGRPCQADLWHWSQNRRSWKCLLGGMYDHCRQHVEFSYGNCRITISLKTSRLGSTVVWRFYLELGMVPLQISGALLAWWVNLPARVLSFITIFQMMIKHLLYLKLAENLWRKQVCPYLIFSNIMITCS